MLSRLTFTGVDASTLMIDLPTGVEYGFLLSLSQPVLTDRSPRYMYPKQIEYMMPVLQSRGCRIALHVCGRQAKLALFENQLLIRGMLRHVDRVQINGKVSVEQLQDVCWRHPSITFITQHGADDAPDDPRLFAECDNHVILVDASGGRGQSPKSWARPVTSKTVGFAGGLGPDNIRSQLQELTPLLGRGWWVDMETKLRDARDQFSVVAVRKVIEEATTWKESPLDVDRRTEGVFDGTAVSRRGGQLMD
jgi:phosphoribosylanthranilate isomerase